MTMQVFSGKYTSPECDHDFQHTGKFFGKRQCVKCGVYEYIFLTKKEKKSKIN